MGDLTTLAVADAPELWQQLGFTVHSRDVCTVGAVHHALGAPGQGIAGWSLSGATGGVDGLPTVEPVTTALLSPDAHPNGVVTLDHLVVVTPDLGRTIDALENVGLTLRRTRDAGRMHQAFFRLGEVILEVVGPPPASGRPASDDPARFYGLAFTVADLEGTAAFLGDRLRPIKEAVQPGRRIATLDRAAGSTVAMAFMSSGGR